ncbi:DUF2120 family protein [Methanobacterium sp.]|uniref:DUF2120 family protein n=1 Tax=Methanobacterium sp. TaxID=2164 RepID=UPI003C72B569
MKPIHKIAGQIMGDLEAFHGSRPAIDADNILIVRGMSRKRFNEELDAVLSNLLKTLGARQIDMFSEEGGSIIGIMDERIRESVNIPSETDVTGVYRLKESLEAMNCNVAYTLGLIDNVGTFIVTWKDKSGIGPQFVEVVVANME